MGVREGQGMAFESLAPRTALSKLSRSQRSIFHDLPDGSIGQLRVGFRQAPAGIEKPLFGPRFLLRRPYWCSSGFSDGSLAGLPCFGFATLQRQDLGSPMHPQVSPESPLDLHPSSAHAPGNLLAIHPVNHTLPTDGVVLVQRPAAADAQHRIQIGFPGHRTMGVAGELWLATKTPVPKG